MGSPVFANGGFEVDGDRKLRGKCQKIIKTAVKESGLKPKVVVDLGCAVGHSTMKMKNSFPDAKVLGLDLSPHMLSVARYNLNTRPEFSWVSGHSKYMHGCYCILRETRLTVITGVTFRPPSQWSSLWERQKTLACLITMPM